MSILKGAAFATAGLLKCGGFSLIAEKDILGIFERESFGSKRIAAERKCSGLYLYECLSIVMGKAFEVYLPKIFNNILGSIADNKEAIRSAALSALKTIMKYFSNLAIK
jgi:hypothetical protein